MIQIKGKANTAFCYAEDIDERTHQDILHLVDLPIFKDKKIAIMPDAHTNGDGTVTGFTMESGESLLLSIERDAGCGVLATKLNIKRKDIDFAKLDEICNEIPAGDHQAYFEPAFPYDFSSLRCYKEIKQHYLWPRLLGTLGGGNHFIELDEDENGDLYLVVHNGLEYYSRPMINYYKKLAGSRLGKSLEEVDPFELVLEGQEKEDYIHDVYFFVTLCKVNRKYIADYIINKMHYKEIESIDSSHHYIDEVDHIIRHGAISAHKGEKVVIPINAKDGTILGVGKGNPDWNYSAPHGGGRKYSKKKAKELYSLEEYKKSMEGIYTSSLSDNNLGEIPYSYRDINTIISAIKESVEVIHILKPIYSYRGKEHRKVN